MKVIDNVNERLGDDLKAELQSGTRLRVAASAFSLYAYEALKGELEQIEGLDFIFTSPTFVTERLADSIPKQRREFFIPQALGHESTLYGSQFEIRLRNRLTQRAIARECAEWVKSKVRFRSNTTGARRCGSRMANPVTSRRSTSPVSVCPTTRSRVGGGCVTP